jgi:hemerythrin superfamily protein
MLVDTSGFHGGVFATLLEEHRVITGMLDELLRRPAGEAAERGAAFTALARTVRAHDRAEEAIVYPPLDGSYELGHHVRIDRRQHRAIEELLQAVERTPADDPAWTGRLSELQRLLARHLADEEGVVIPRARFVISGQHASELLLAYERERDRILGELEAEAIAGEPGPAPTWH